MRRLLEPALGLVVGTICGGVIGAAMLAVPTYFQEGCSMLGCAKDWVIVGIYLGLVFGGIAGAIIGVTVCAASSNKTTSVIIGAAIGSIITIVLFLMGAAGEEVVAAWAILSIPAGAIVGLITSTCVGILRVTAETN
jgi:hypothetical protein